MAEAPVLRGITWNHARGYLPLVAVSQWYEDTYPEVQILWEKRSLKDFGDFPLDQLAERYDLLVIDHPFMGYAAAHGPLLPLEGLLPQEFLRDQAEGSVGRSFESYWFGDHLWALPIDAAAPVSSWRPDLLDVKLPATWEEVCDLAERGLAIAPATPVDSLMNFYMFCCGLGEDPFASSDGVISEEVGAAALEYLKNFVDLCSPDCLLANPISVYRKLTLSNAHVYCPFAFSYSNYARIAHCPDTRSRPLQFGNLVALPGGKKLRSTLGGTGLAISSHCENVELAVEFAKTVADPACQRGIYFNSGGQPAHRSAWADAAVNAGSNGFFQNTLATLDDAYLRPRFDGYVCFQDEASLIVHRYLREGSNCLMALRELESLRKKIITKESR